MVKNRQKPNETFKIGLRWSGKKEWKRRLLVDGKGPPRRDLFRGPNCIPRDRFEEILPRPKIGERDTHVHARAREVLSMLLSSREDCVTGREDADDDREINVGAGVISRREGGGCCSVWVYLWVQIWFIRSNFSRVASVI